MSEEQPNWSVDIGYASQAELRKYQAKHAREYEACFANLEKLLKLLKRGMDMRSFQLGFLRNEQGDLYRISQSGVAHAAETRLYLYPAYPLSAWHWRKKASARRHSEVYETDTTDQGAKMKTRFSTAAEAAAALAGKPAVARRVRKRVEAARIVTELLALRTERGMMQAEVAKRMGCGQAKISKLEAGTDAQLSVSELCAYLKALGISARLVIDNRHLPVAQRIKQHVFALHALLEELAKLAQQVSDDTEIVARIHTFYGEVLFNFVVRFGESYEKVRSLIALQPPQQAGCDDTSASQDMPVQSATRISRNSAAISTN